MAVYRCDMCGGYFHNYIIPCHVFNGETTCPDCYLENAWQEPEKAETCSECGAELGPPGKEIYPKTGEYENRYVMGDKVVCLDCYDGAPE